MLLSRAIPIADLRRIALLLEFANEPSFRVRAFRNAAATARRAGAEVSWKST